MLPGGRSHRRLRARAILPVLVVLLMGVPLGALAVASTSSFLPVQPSSGGTTSGLGAASTFVPAVLPPRHASGTPGLTSALSVDPYAYYSSEPAPMGIADFGVDKAGNSYHYSTSTILGSVLLKKLTLYDSSHSTYIGTIQLNVVLWFKSGSQQYQFWVQNVVQIDTSSNTVNFENNIWNFTAGNSAGMGTNTVTGNGTTQSDGAGVNYYAAAAGSQSGNGASLTYPATVQVRVVAAVSGGTPEVYFEFDDGQGWQGFDVAQFSFTRSVSSDSFVVEGGSYVDSSFFSDAELVFGGECCGYSTAMTKGDVNLTLQFDNGHNLQEIPNAYGFGSDTGESVSSVSGALATAVPTGTMVSRLTSGSGSLNNLYDRSYSAIFNGTTTFASGTYSINGTSLGSFRNNEVNLTLAPGRYNISLRASATLSESVDITLSPGEYLAYNFNPPKTYTVTFDSSGIPPGTSWGVILGGRINATLTNSLSFQMPNGTYTYQVQDSPGYQPNLTGGVVTVLGRNVTIGISWTELFYPVHIFETGLPAGTAWALEFNGSPFTVTGTSLNLSYPNGSYNYRILGAPGYAPNPRSGVLVVFGGLGSQAASLGIVFSAILYPVRFTETGLPGGTGWTVTVAGVNHTVGAGGLGVNLANGTYPFVVWSSAPYAPTPPNGNVLVAGTNVSEPITFTPRPGTLLGEVNPGSATVYVNGTAVSVVAGNYSLELPPGVYAIKVSAPGYATYYDNVTIGPGQSEPLNVNLQPTSNPHSNPPGPAPTSFLDWLLSTEGLLVLAAVAVIAVVAAVAATRRARGARPPA